MVKLTDRRDFLKVLGKVSVLAWWALSIPTPAYAQRSYPKKVERWRKLVVHYLKTHDVYSQRNVDICLTIIERESGGSAGCKTGNCWGLFQMDDGWKWWKHLKRRHKKYLRGEGSHYLHHRKVSDWRLCGACAIHRFVHQLVRVEKHQSWRYVTGPWAATYPRDLI